MALPYDLYLRFLVTTGLDEVAAVNERLDELGLPGVTEKQLVAQSELVSSVIPDSIQRQIDEGVYSSDFLKWMKILEVEDLWLYEKPFRNEQSRYTKLVYDIHQDPQLRLTLNALLMKGGKPADLAQDLSLKFSALLKEPHIDLYERFFWNVRRMTRRDWRSFLAGCGEREKAIYFVALTEPLDVLRTELELSSKISVSDTLQYLLTRSFQKAKQYLRLTTKDANAEARAWIDEVLKLADKYEKHRTGDVADFGKALQMEFDYTETDFPVPDSDTLRDLQSKMSPEAGKDSESGNKKNA